MTIAKRQSLQRFKKSPPRLWFERVMALLALTNLTLVFFDLSYIPLRDFWLQGRVQLFIKIGKFEYQFPQQALKIFPFRVSNWYDWVKGIEPYRDTQQYLERVEDLNDKINQVALQTPEEPNQDFPTEEETIDTILKDLRDRSVEMVDTNPFQIANKTGTLERIKNKMREHIFGDKEASAKEAFRRFWSREYLTKNGFRQELNFFDREIKPLIETNYFRPVGENGEFIDNFGLIDLPFSLIFALEFLARTWYISRDRTGVSWTDAMLWRWYDVFLFIPLFRWLRVIPVTIRLNQAQLIDLRAIQKQASQGFVASIAEDMTEVVVMQVINQVQGSIRRGEIGNFLAQRNVREYIDINETNETAEIAKLIAQLTVYQVLPKIRPDIEALLQYNIKKVLKQSPAYQGIEQLPGMERLQATLTEQLVKGIYQAFSDVLNSLLEADPVFDELLERLVTNFSQAMGSEIQAKHSLERIESLLTDLLEEIKINYVEGVSEEDVEEILEQTRALRKLTKTSPQLKSS